MSADLPPFRLSLLGPVHWPAWIGLALLWLLSRLPYAVLMRVGRGLGWLFVVLGLMADLASYGSGEGARRGRS